MLNASDLEAFGYYDPNEGQQTDIRQTCMSMVREFARKTGQKPDAVLYSGLIAEESDEWRSAHVQNNRENELKELADLVYVIYGYANARGWELDEAIRRVHKNNLGRCIQPDGTVQRRADGKIVRNPDYPAVKLGDLI